MSEQHHYLILQWAEEPDNGTFSDDLDWEISHPPTCEMTYPPGAPDWGLTWNCAFQWEIDNTGVDVFGDNGRQRANCWSAVPAIFPVEHYHEEVRIGWETEHETGIRPISIPANTNQQGETQ